MDIFFALNGEQIDNRKIGKTKTFLRLFFIKIVIIFNGNLDIKNKAKTIFLEKNFNSKILK